MANLVKKLSVKAICGKTEKPTKHVPLARIFGTVTGVTTGFSETVGREWTALVGAFEGVNLETGEVFDSGKCFLPEPAGSMLASAIIQNPGTHIDFAVEIGVKPTNTAIGYEYTVRNLADPVADDKLTSMRQLYAPEAKAALEAPKAAPGKARK